MHIITFNLINGPAWLFWHLQSHPLYSLHITSMRLP